MTLRVVSVDADPAGVFAVHRYTPSSSGKASVMVRLYMSFSALIWKNLDCLTCVEPLIHATWDPEIIFNRLLLELINKVKINEEK